MQVIIPEHLTGRENLEAFLAFLRGLRLDPEDKRQFLMDWCDRVGVKITGDMIKRAGIE